MKPSPTYTKSRVVRVSLTKRGESVVVRAKAEMGITQVAMLERLLEWFAAQDPRIRTMILSPYLEVRRGLARLVLEEMEAQPQKDFDVLPKFDGLVDHDFTGAQTTSQTSGKANAISTTNSGPKRARS